MQKYISRPNKYRGELSAYKSFVRPSSNLYREDGANMPRGNVPESAKMICRMAYTERREYRTMYRLWVTRYEPRPCLSPTEEIRPVFGK